MCTICLTTKLMMLIKRLLSTSLARQREVMRNSRKDREQWRGKPHGSLHDLSVILYYGVISVYTVHWTMYLMWCVCIVGRAHCNGCIGGPPMEGVRCVVFALLEEIIGGCSAHCAHRWKRSLEGESMRSREQ